jgi:hypothetical protein
MGNDGVMYRVGGTDLYLDERARLYEACEQRN